MVVGGSFFVAHVFVAGDWYLYLLNGCQELSQNSFYEDESVKPYSDDSFAVVEHPFMSRAFCLDMYEYDGA